MPFFFRPGQELGSQSVSLVGGRTHHENRRHSFTLPSCMYVRIVMRGIGSYDVCMYVYFRSTGPW